MSLLNEIARESVTFDRLTLFQRLRMLWWEWRDTPQHDELRRLWDEGMTAEAAYHKATNHTP